MINIRVTKLLTDISLSSCIGLRWYLCVLANKYKLYLLLHKVFRCTFLEKVIANLKSLDCSLFCFRSEVVEVRFGSVIFAYYILAVRTLRCA